MHRGTFCAVLSRRTHLGCGSNVGKTYSSKAAKPCPCRQPRRVAVQGGASEARARLKHYFWDTKKLAVYKKTRNGLVGADYSSKFSPWLASGCISPRRIASEVYRFEDNVEANDSTYRLVFELIWRDYFRFIAMKFGSRIFHRKALKPESANRGTQRPAFEAWKEEEPRTPL